MPPPHQPDTFTGRRARRRTRLSVRFGDGVARSLITIGGLGTILAVAGVGLFLIWVVLPLFMPARAEVKQALPAPPAGAPPVHVAVDEYRTIGWTCSRDGELTLFRMDDGAILERRRLFDDRQPIAWSFAPAEGSVVAGFADGSIAALQVGFRTSYLAEADVPEALYALDESAVAPWENGLVQRTPEGQFRLQTLLVRPIGAPQQITDGPCLAVSHIGGEEGMIVAALTGARPPHRLVVVQAEQRTNMLTGEQSLTFRTPVELPALPRPDAPAWLRVAGSGRMLFAAWPDGEAVRIITAGQPVLAERFDLLPDPTLELTSLEFLLGRTTLIAGDSAGGLTGWFAAEVPPGDDAPPTTDGLVMAPAHPIEPGDGAAVVAIAPATRSRMFLAGFDDATLGLYFMTSGLELLELPVPEGRAPSVVAMAPKENGLIAVAGDRILHYDLDPGYAEISLRSLFTPIWYEGYADPQHTWQSSSGTDDFEPKFGLVPLIFGTLKATFYSMLFGAPLALLAAVHTSEFLSPRLRAWIKPTIELMASLPSVVLGFLAALVFAPYIERMVPTALSAFFTIPLAFIVGALLWQLLPRSFTLRFAGRRLLFIVIMLIPGAAAATVVGPLVETLLFGGSIVQWLNGLHPEPPVGRPLGGLVLLLLPITAAGVAIFMSLRVNLWLRRRTQHLGRRGAAAIDLAKFGIGLLAALAITVGLGLLLGSLGVDLRKPLPLTGPFLDTYDQRNSLVVGFVMGFAIIPIIYTIADDALTAVPEHLRSASLGAGATPWQTALRIIVPTAMSGLFSALMIGLGRAVGETMIVLMAAGNTPVMNMNIFEGFRTLSANIAVELPEAPVGGTHYRTLFLAALVLFIMTFAVNTIAEGVRLRFRRRAYQL